MKIVMLESITNSIFAEAGVPNTEQVKNWNGELMSSCQMFQYLNAIWIMDWNTVQFDLMNVTY